MAPFRWNGPHFKPDDFVEGTSRRRLKKGAVPSVFEWNRINGTVINGTKSA